MFFDAMKATVYINLEDVAELWRCKRALISFAAHVLRYKAYTGFLASPEFVEEFSDEQLQVVRYWSFTRILKLLAAKLVPHESVSVDDVELFVEKHYRQICSDLQVGATPESLNYLATRYSIVFASPFHKSLDKLVFGILKAKSYEAKQATAVKRANEACKRGKARFIVLTTEKAAAVYTHPFTLDCGLIGSYFDQCDAKESKFYELLSESRSYEQEQFVSEPESGAEASKSTTNLPYIASQLCTTAQYSTRFAFYALITNSDSTQLLGSIMYVQQQDDRCAHGFCLVYGQYVAASVELGCLQKLEQPKDYFSRSTTLRCILLIENQTIPVFVKVCCEVLLARPCGCTTQAIKQASKHITVDQRRAITRGEPLSLVSDQHAFSLLVSFLESKINYLIYGVSVERFYKCISGPSVLFWRQINLSLMHYQRNFLVCTMLALGRYAGFAPLFSSYIAHYIAQYDDLAAVIQYWLMHASEVFDHFGCLCNGETWDYIY